MGKKTTVQAPTPDPNIGLAAAAQANLGREWLDEARNQFQVASDRQNRQDDVVREVVADQLSASRTAQQWANEDRARYATTFVPLQNAFINKAAGWDSAGRQQEVAREARADVLTSAEIQRGTAQRQAAALGISPTSGRYAGVERAGEAATALAAAGAENTARSRVRREAVALQADAINMGNGLAVNPGQSLGLGVQAGSAAAGNTAANNAAARSNFGVMQSGYQGAMGGYAGQAGVLGQQYGQQISAWNASQARAGQETAGLYGAIGSIAGSAAGIFMASSEEVKEDKRPTEGALEAVMNMPVEEWTYKEGHGDEGRHIGPYAEDFQRETGKGDGKTINVIDAIGITMRATQELAEEVREMRGALRGKAKPKGRGVMREAA